MYIQQPWKGKGRWGNETWVSFDALFYDYILIKCLHQT